MGMRVDLYRSDYDSELNAFHGRRTVVVVNAEGPFEPTDETPAAELSRNAFGNPIIVPLERPDGALGPMFGGTYAATSDSRFQRATKVYGAIPVHDRFESPALHEWLPRR